jgi:microcystin-dependent protein
MAEKFLGEIRMFGGNFAPRDWALCNGQLLTVNQYEALFSLLGTIYGGDGRTTFGLPDLRGRLPVHAGNGPGLSPRRLGSRAGTETESLTQAQLPAHAHSLQGSADSGTEAAPEGNFLASSSFALSPYSIEVKLDAALAVGLKQTGGSQAHHNMQPFLCVNFIIALQGIYPSRS